MAAPKATIRPACEFDVLELAANMRPVEVQEIYAAVGRPPLPVLLEALDSSAESWSLFIDDKLVCMWGVVPGRSHLLTGRTGIGWLLTTDLVEKHPITFWKLCLRVLPELLERWGELVNAIDARHEQAVRWARRLGFKLEEACAGGFAGVPFYAFSVRKGDLRCALQR